MSKADRTPSLRRALLAILLATLGALLLMPAFTLVPRLLFWGGPFGPAFALFIAPIIGLFVGAYIAPLTVLLAVLILTAMVFGLTALSRTQAVARRWWAWAMAGIAGGAAAGTALALEIMTFGFDLPDTAVSGGATGAICALIARKVSGVQPR
jgi:hypothetical protein